MALLATVQCPLDARDEPRSAVPGPSLCARFDEEDRCSGAQAGATWA